MSGALGPGLEGLQQQGRRAGHKQTHGRAGLGVQARLAQKAHIQGGHAHEDGGLRQIRQHLLGLKARHPNHFAAVEQRAVQGDKQAVHMEDGQAVDQHIPTALRPCGSRPAPVFLEHLGIAQQITMAEHGTLAAAGGAAGVDHGRQIAGFARGDGVHIAVLRSALEQAALALVVQREHILRAGLKGELAGPAEIAWAANQHRRFGIAQKVGQFAALVGHIERQIHKAGAQRGQVEQHGFDRFVHMGSDAAACGQAQRLQQIGQHGRGAVQIAPGIVQAGLGLDGNLIQIAREAGAQGSKKIVLGHGETHKNRSMAGADHARAAMVQGFKTEANPGVCAGRRAPALCRIRRSAAAWGSLCPG